MSSKQFWSMYIILAICQMVVCNFFNFSPLVSLSILPAMVLCIPASVRTPWAMIIAFITALAVDFISDGVLGLNALALVPVALCRNGILRLVLGNDLSGRLGILSIKTKGLAKISSINIIALAIYFLVYIAADEAGTRPFLFSTIHFVLSVVVSFVLSLIVTEVLSPKESK